MTAKEQLIQKVGKEDAIKYIEIVKLQLKSMNQVAVTKK